MSIGGATLNPPAAESRLFGQSGARRFWRRLLRKKIAVICLAFIVLFYGAGILAPYVAQQSYTDQNLDNVFASPSWTHPFGTDRVGRDMLSRNIFAARTTVVITLAVVSTGSVMLPLTLGMLAGYRGGWIDATIQRTGEILSSLPGLPMLVLINVTLRPKFEDFLKKLETPLMSVDWPLELVGWGIDRGDLSRSVFADYFIISFVLAFFGWFGGARLIRTQVLMLKSSEYVLAAEASGARTIRVLFRHILPNVMPLVILGASASLGAIAASEIGLTFLGVGVQPPNPSFGALIDEGRGRAVLANHPQIFLVPATVVTLSILAFNLLGDAINDVLTPRAK